MPIFKCVSYKKRQSAAQKSLRPGEKAGGFSLFAGNFFESPENIWKISE